MFPQLEPSRVFSLRPEMARGLRSCAENHCILRVLSAFSKGTPNVSSRGHACTERNVREIVRELCQGFWLAVSHLLALAPPLGVLTPLRPLGLREDLPPVGQVGIVSLSSAAERVAKSNCSRNERLSADLRTSSDDERYTIVHVPAHGRGLGGPVPKTRCMYVCMHAVLTQH